ncbi:MAG TPA: hypothetical protein VGM43_17585 [Bryobacteraceae bacterium]
MDCARKRPMDAAVRAALTAHLEVCANCSRALERQIRLSAAMGALAERAADVSAPPSVEQAILAELSAVSAYARRRWIYAGVGAALAASVAMALWLGSGPAPKKIEAHVSPTLPATVVEASAPVPMETASVQAPVKRALKRRVKPAPRPEAPFIAIPYTPPLDPRERVDVVRMDVPVAALIAAGLPVGTADPASHVRTDVLLGQDGRARAVRLVAAVSSN